MNIQHYLTFASDQRISMQIYADNCQAALQHVRQPILQYQPESRLEQYSSSPSMMRLLRYVYYPYLVSRQQTKQAIDIHHVLDHGYAHLLPKLKQGSKLVTVHDLIPLLAWKGIIELGRPVKKPYLNLYSLGFLAGFDAIITPSHNTKADLLNYFPLEDTDIYVVPPGLQDCFRVYSEQQVLAFKQKYQLGSNVRLIMISGREFYKNHAVCLRVLQNILRLTEQPVCLLKSGLPSPEFEQQVIELGLKSHVRCLFLEDVNELPLLYNSVDCLLFPSLYEGFGMPVVEALACGTPVVTSNVSALPEVAGKLAQQCTVDDIEQITQAVLEAITSQDMQCHVADQAEQWVKQFRLPVMSDKLMKVYQDLSHNPA